jgi:uncharacterized glyoxalase superfamily protein PhnB
MNENHPPVLNQVNLIANDLAASVRFYQRLGLTVEHARLPEWAPHHATVMMPGGMRLEIDSVEFAKQWNTGLRNPAGGGAGCVLFFGVPSRREVDRLFEVVIAAHYGFQTAPQDAFWGARYAIVEDPDRNAVGFMSPIDPERQYGPPPPPGSKALV